MSVNVDGNFTVFSFIFPAKVVSPIFSIPSGKIISLSAGFPCALKFDKSGAPADNFNVCNLFAPDTLYPL